VTWHESEMNDSPSSSRSRASATVMDDTVRGASGRSSSASQAAEMQIGDSSRGLLASSQPSTDALCDVVD
jgi:hypothetical protein